MLNRSASLAMSTCVLKALPGKLDIKRHSPSILYLSDTEAPNLDLDLSITYSIVSVKIYDKRDDLNKKVFPFLDGAVPRAPAFSVYI